LVGILSISEREILIKSNVEKIQGIDMIDWLAPWFPNYLVKNNNIFLKGNLTNNGQFQKSDVNI